MFENLLKKRSDYKWAPVDCKILQKLSRKAYEQILTILGKPMERHKDYADVYIFSDLSDEQVKPLLAFLLARRIQHRWVLALETTYNKPAHGYAGTALERMA